MDIEDVHKSAKLLIDGVPYNVDSAEFVKPGNAVLFTALSCGICLMVA